MTKAASAAASPTVVQKLLLIGFGLAVLAIGVTLLEVTLGLAGIGDPQLYEDPFVGFSASRDLFVRTRSDNGEDVFQTSPEKLAFFNHQQFPAEKAPGTYRIFALGGSTTAGRPYDSEFAYPAWLQRYLDQAAPGRRFEVINAGGISYASYRVTILMRELLRYEPDLFIVYTGHNEFLEERTYSGIIHQSELLKSVRLRLNGLRSYTIARSVVRKARGTAPDLPTTLDADVATRLDSWRGLDLYEQDDELRSSIVAHFEYNLRQMTAMASDAGVELLFVKPISNIKDFSPFKSEARTDLGPATSAQIDEHLKRARELLLEDRADEACALTESAVDLDPGYAQSHFQLGQCRLALEQYADARSAFVRAKEFDVAPLRALEVMIDLVPQVATDAGVSIVDLPVILEADSESRFGHDILGSEYLLDHVHPDTPVHSLIAEEILHWMADRGIAAVSADWSGATRQAIFEAFTESMNDRYYAQRDLNLAKVLGWAGKLEEAEGPLRRASSVLSDEPEVHLNLGIVLQRTGRPQEAATELERAIELDPQSPPALFNLGVVYSSTGRPEAAIEKLEQALRLQPEYPEALYNLGLVQGNLGRWEQSLETFGKALQLRPGTAEIHRKMAASYRELGRFEAALASLGDADKIDPDNAASGIERAIALAESGDPTAAIETIRKTLATHPHHAEAQFSLGLLLAGQGLAQQAVDAYAAALESDPRHTSAHNNLGILLARLGDPASAEEHLLTALQIDPTYADAHFNLGIVYDSVARRSLALDSVRKAVELDPGNDRFRQALELLLAADQ